MNLKIYWKLINKIKMRSVFNPYDKRFNMIQKKCKNCNKIFWIKGNLKRDIKFCSSLCFFNQKKTNK